MTHEPGHGDFEREAGGEGIPPELTEDLRSLYRADGPTRRVDDAVMAAARERFAGMRVGERPGGFFVVVRRIGLVGGPVAAAAVLAIVVWLTPWRPGMPRGPVPMPGMARQQVQGELEKQAGKKMSRDRLAFNAAEGKEQRLGLAEKDETMSAGLADAAGKAAYGGEREVRAGAPMLAAEATPRWAEDFNGDGVVDMRDALMMARVVERGKWSMGMQWDLNGDGVVNEKDVHVVALAAVDLERHGEVLR